MDVLYENEDILAPDLHTSIVLQEWERRCPHRHLKFIFYFHHPKRQKTEIHFLIPLVETHVSYLNRKIKVVYPIFLLNALFSGVKHPTLLI